jgi:hypothetical protein
MIAIVASPIDYTAPGPLTSQLLVEGGAAVRLGHHPQLHRDPQPSRTGSAPSQPMEVT